MVVMVFEYSHAIVVRMGHVYAAYASITSSKTITTNQTKKSPFRHQLLVITIVNTTAPQTPMTTATTN